MTISWQNGIVVVLAGRRVDPEMADVPRFPLENAPRVRTDIYLRLRELRASILVCSAACGADLLALDAAQQLDIRTRIIIPFSAEQFRQTSVVDRPHPALWGPIYNSAIAAARAHEDLVELGSDVHDKSAYSATTTALIEQAQSLATESEPQITRPIALTVWDGTISEPGDQTKEFSDAARKAGFDNDEIITLWDR
jgi:hypothetical protein